MNRHQYYRKYVQTDEQKSNEKERVEKFRKDNPDKVASWNRTRNEKAKAERMRLKLPENNTIREKALSKERKRKRNSRAKRSKTKMKKDREANTKRMKMKRKSTIAAQLKRFVHLIERIDWDLILKKGKAKYVRNSFGFTEIKMNTSNIPKKYNKQKKMLLEYMAILTTNKVFVMRHKSMNATVLNHSVFEHAEIDGARYRIPKKTDNVNRSTIISETNEVIWGMQDLILQNKMIAFHDMHSGMDSLTFKWPGLRSEKIHLDRRIKNAKYVGRKNSWCSNPESIHLVDVTFYQV